MSAMLTMDDIVAIVKPHNDKLIAEGRAETAERKLAQAVALLEELEDYFDDRADVVDGSYGEPAPNTEMQWATRIKEALGKGGF